MTDKLNLSDDALVILTSIFKFGPKASLKVGGQGAQSRLSERGRKALTELVEHGLLSAEEYNQYGKMIYQGTDKLGEAINNKRFKFMSLKDMEQKGRWSMTEKNPDYQPDGK